MEKLIYGNNGPFSSTIEDVYVANIETDRGTKEKIRFYDTAGLDSQQREVPRHLLAAADGFVIVYSVEDKQSFTLAEAIRKEIKNCGEKKDQVVLVLGTKVDLAESRKVDSGIAQVINGCLCIYIFI